MVLAGWLLGTLGVVVLAYKIKPATGPSTKDDEEFIIPADPVPATLEPVALPATEKRAEAPARPETNPPKVETTLGAPISASSGTGDNIVLAKGVSGGEAVPAAADTESK